MQVCRLYVWDPRACGVCKVLLCFEGDRGFVRFRVLGGLVGVLARLVEFGRLGIVRFDRGGLRCAAEGEASRTFSKKTSVNCRILTCP